MFKKTERSALDLAMTRNYNRKLGIELALTKNPMVKIYNSNQETLSTDNVERNKNYGAAAAIIALAFMA